MNECPIPWKDPGWQAAAMIIFYRLRVVCSNGVWECIISLLQAAVEDNCVLKDQIEVTSYHIVSLHCDNHGKNALR